tara:strand:+ start:327 stop:539 length:213 start_codon:yes stop_codon:yes gene_type:complete
MFSKFDVSVSVCEVPAYQPTAADLAEYQQWQEQQEEQEQQERDARNRRTMDYMDGLQQDQGHCLDFDLQR